MTAAEWWANFTAQIILFFMNCACCGADRRQSEISPPALIRNERESYPMLPTIPVAAVANRREGDSDDWDVVEAQEADMFGIHARNRNMIY